MKRLLIYFFVFFNAVAHGQTAPEEVITNQTIVQLHKAQLSKDVITAKINSTKCNFDLSAEGLIALKKAGVPEEVINAMLLKGNGSSAGVKDKNGKSSPYDDFPPGIYHFDSAKNDYVQIDPTPLGNRRSGGVSGIIGPSVINSKTKASLDGSESKQRIPTATPVFIFVFDVSEREFNRTQSNGFLDLYFKNVNVQSPKEFFLLRLTQTRDSREIVTGKRSTISSDIGIDDKAKMRFDFDKIKNGVYKVWIEKPLPKGEYGFMIAVSSSPSVFQNANQKVYDFSVR